MDSINVVINDSRATKMVQSEDNDVFESWGTIEASTVDEDFSIDITNTEPPKATEDEKKGSSLPKWENGAHSANNIIGNVEVVMKNRYQIHEMLNYIRFTFTILPKNVNEA